MLLPKLLLPAALFSFLLSPAQAAVEMQQEADRIKISIDGQPFTEYCFTGAPHVYFYPLLGPGGVRMTREWPMQDVPGEEHDHPHHRSLWFAHGDVNGLDFWTEPASSGQKPPKPNLGQILHDKFLEVQGGDKEGVIKDSTRWQAADGTVPLTGVQTFRVYARPLTERLFDFDVTLTAGDKDVVMGDTKEGAMALRLAETMRLTHAKKVPGQGHILNSEGVRDGDVWGKRARWVDYSGPVGDKVVGVTIFDHPQNGPQPTRWHARDYGLFAANPFCSHEMDPSEPAGSGARTIPAGQSLTLRYRFYLHEGPADQKSIAEQYNAYTAHAK